MKLWDIIRNKRRHSLEARRRRRSSASHRSLRRESHLIAHLSTIENLHFFRLLALLTYLESPFRGCVVDDDGFVSSSWVMHANHGAHEELFQEKVIFFFLLLKSLLRWCCWVVQWFFWRIFIFRLWLAFSPHVTLHPCMLLMLPAGNCTERKGTAIATVDWVRFQLFRLSDCLTYFFLLLDVIHLFIHFCDVEKKKNPEISVSFRPVYIPCYKLRRKMNGINPMKWTYKLAVKINSCA